MSNVKCEMQFAKTVNQYLQELQDRLITLRASGESEDQCITPTLLISFDELKEETGRVRLKSAVIDNFSRKLRRYGCEVEILEVGIEITKPAKNIPTHNDSFKGLQHQLRKLKLDEETEDAFEEEWVEACEVVDDTTNNYEIVYQH